MRQIPNKMCYSRAVRTTIEIPDETYNAVSKIAAEENSTVEKVVLESLKTFVEQRSTQQPAHRRLALPLIRSKRTDRLEIDSEKIYDIIDFP